MSKRLLSLLLAFVMLFSLLPDAALAAEDGELPEQKLEDTELMPENDPDELPGEPEEGDPEQPGEPGEPEEPEEIELPEEPEVPEVIEQPEEPEEIEQSEVPEEPEESGEIEAIDPGKIDPNKPGKIDPDKPDKIGPDKPVTDGADEEDEEETADAVCVRFVCTPAEAEVLLFAAPAAGETLPEDASPIEPETDGSYLLVPGEYLYTVSCEGYVSLEAQTLTVEPQEDELTVPVALEADGDGAKTTDHGEVYKSGSCGPDANYTLYVDHVMVISGNGAMNSYQLDRGYCAPWYSVRGYVQSVIFESGITTIGFDSFSNCTNLSSVSFSPTVTTIDGCAFEGCSSLSHVTLPPAATSFGPFVFLGCPLYSAGLTGSGCDIEFAWTDAIPASAFSGTSITSILIPETVTSIGFSAFFQCDSLTSVSIPSSVTSIGGYAFAHCVNLNLIRFAHTAGSPLSIGSSAFLAESTLPTAVCVSDPENVNSAISAYAWADGNRPVRYYPLTYTIPPDQAIDGVIYRHLPVPCWIVSGHTDALPAQVTIPAEISGYPVTSIGESAFQGCSSLTSVLIPSTVTSIGNSAFYNCRRLTGITLPDSVTSIGINAFRGCSSLMGIAIPEGVTSIGRWAFYDCSSLTSVSIPVSMETIGCGAFLSSGLRDVFYGGTRAQWNEIDIENISNYGGSNEVLLNANLHCKPEILTQPTSITVGEGKTATFRVSAADAESYQWHYRSSPDGDWESLSIPGSNTDTLAFDVTAAQDGCQYRCEVISAAGSVYSDTAALTVLVKPKITTQPAGINVTPGTTVTFKVVAAGGDLHYQWYMREAGGNLKALSAASAKKDTLKVVTKLEHDGRQYCCKVWNAGGSTYTKTVTLEVKDVKPKITTQPSNFNVIAGTSVTFHVAATGGNLKYQWYMREAGGTLKALSAVSAKTDTLKVVTKPAHDGRQYCCKVYNSAGSTYTKTVTLHVEIAKPVIKTQPENATCIAGNYVTFSVAAIGGNLKYQWYWKDSSGTMTALTDDSAKTSTLEVFAATSYSYHGRQYCCKVYNSAGSTMTASASLSVARNPKYRALCVGNENYSPVLPGCLNDMNTMAGMLSGLANSFEVSTLPDASAGEILNAISYAYAGATEDDVSLFSYSGHGLNDGGGSYMGALVGTDGSYLTTSRLANALSAVPGRVIVLLDSCHSGALIGRDGKVTQATAADLDAFNQSVISAFAACDSTIVFEQSELMLDEESGEPVPKSGELNGRTKFIVITAASMSETSSSIHGSNGWYGLFTRAFVEGCGSGYPGGSYTGSIPCDSNGDSQISVSEIYYYVKSITGNKQHAQCYAADMSEVMFMR